MLARVLPTAAFVLIGVALLARRRLSAKTYASSPRRRHKQKHRRGGRKNEELELALALEPAFAAECYAARKAASTSTAVTLEWITANVHVLVAPPTPVLDATAAALSPPPPPLPQALNAELALAGVAAAALDAEAAKPGTFTVLSVGCGDGELDQHLILALQEAAGSAGGDGATHARPKVTKLHYVGLEPCRPDAAAFRARIDAARAAGRLGPNAVAYVLEEAFEDRLRQPDEHRPDTPVFRSRTQFDLVVVANALNYFRDPHAALQVRARARATPSRAVSPTCCAAVAQRLVAQTKSGGRLLLVHPAARGVAEIQAELMRVKGSEEHMCHADELKRLLSLLRLQCATTHLHARLNVSESLARSSTGVQILSSILECDLRRLCERKMMRLLKTCWRLASIDEDGSAHVDETVAVFVVDKPLSRK